MKKTTIVLFGILTALLSSCIILPMDYEETFSRKYSADEYQLVSIHNITGSVTFRESSDDFITVSGVKTSYTQEGLTAISILEGSPIDSTSGDKELRITTTIDSADHGNAQVHYEIYAPPGTKLKITNETGDVDVRNSFHLNRLRISTGNADLRGLLSARDIEITTGKLILRDTGLTGNMSVTTGDIIAEIRELGGNSSLKVTTGKLHVQVHPELNASISTNINTGSSSNTATTANSPYVLNLSCNTGEIKVSQLITD